MPVPVTTLPTTVHGPLTTEYVTAPVPDCAVDTVTVAVGSACATLGVVVAVWLALLMTNDCTTGTAASKASLPGCVAVSSQVPALSIVTVVAVAVHTLGSVGVIVTTRPVGFAELPMFDTGEMANGVGLKARSVGSLNTIVCGAFVIGPTGTDACDVEPTTFERVTIERTNLPSAMPVGTHVCEVAPATSTQPVGFGAPVSQTCHWYAVDGVVSSWSFHVPVDDDRVDPRVVVVPVVAVITGGAVFVGVVVMIVDCQVEEDVAVLPAASWYEPLGTATNRVPAVGLVAETANRYCVGDTCVTEPTVHPVELPPSCTSVAVNAVPLAGASVSVAVNVNDVAEVGPVPVADGEELNEIPADVSIVAVKGAVAGEELPARSCWTAEKLHVPSDSAELNVHDWLAFVTVAMTHVTSGEPGFDAVTTARVPTSSPVRSIVGVLSLVIRSLPLTPVSDAVASEAPLGAAGGAVSMIMATVFDAADSAAPNDCFAVTFQVPSTIAAKVHEVGLAVTATGPHVTVSAPCVAVKVTLEPIASPVASYVGVVSAVVLSVDAEPVSDAACRSMIGGARTTGADVALIADVDPVELVAVTPSARYAPTSSIVGV